MSIESGVYLLRHHQSDHALGVDDADWNNGEVECWEAKKTNTDPMDLIFQRFLIHPNPAQNGTVNILSLRAGAYLVHNAKGVRAKATCAHAKECLWVPEEVHGKDGTFKFHPFKNNKKFLTVDDPKDSKSTAILAAPAEEGGKFQKAWWKLDRTDMDAEKIADWMSMVTPQSTKFSMMSMVGTHQTLALNKGGKGPFALENPHCQNQAPYLQLCGGMRFFDLRLNYHPYDDEGEDSRPGLIARHGIHPVAFVWEGYSFSAVCQSVAAFLAQHKGETVFIRAKLEGDIDGDPKKWGDTFYDELVPWQDYFYHVDGDKGVVDLSLDDCRGKAIIFSGLFQGGIKAPPKGKFPPPLNNWIPIWKTHGHQTAIALEGPPEQLSVSEFPDHAKVMTKFLETAAADEDPHNFYWLGLNSSGKPAVGIAAGELYNPIDYTKWMDKNWVPTHMNEKKHPKGTRLGLITFDFYELVKPFVKFVVERNPGVEV